MALGTILSLIFILIVGIIIYKLTKSIMKGVFISISILSLILLISGVMLISDVMEIKENFPTKPNLYLLEDNKYIAGFSTIASENAELTLINSVKIEEYNKKDLEDIIENNYKLFIINKKSLDLIKSVKIGNNELTIEELKDLIKSETPIEDFLSKDIPRNQLESAKRQLMNQYKITDESQFKGMLFAIALSSEENMMLFILNNLNGESAQIYPETIAFKLLKKVPLSLLENAITKINGGE